MYRFMVIVSIFVMVLTGCAGKHRIYTVWMNNDHARFKKDSSICMANAKSESGPLSARWSNGFSELIFTDKDTDISKKSPAQEYYNCMATFGQRIQAQSISLKGKEINESHKALEKCEYLKNTDNEFKRCVSEYDWFFLTAEPWVYESDGIDVVTAKIHGNYIPPEAVDNVRKESGYINISGTWKGQYNSSRSGKQSATITFLQNDSNLAGNFTSTSGGLGDISGKVSSESADFTITITTPGCSGQFAGTARIVEDGMRVTYKGSTNDACGGAESGSGILVRQN